MRTARHYDVTNATIIIMPGLAISQDYYAPRPEELLPAGAVSDKVAQEIGNPIHDRPEWQQDNYSEEPGDRVAYVHVFLS